MKDDQDTSNTRNWFHHAYRLRDRTLSVYTLVYTYVHIGPYFSSEGGFRYGHDEGTPGEEAALRTPAYTSLCFAIK